MKVIKKGTIFVSIASYRDDVCNSTVKSLYEMADKPNNVFLGICQQNKKDDMDCVINFEDNKNIKILRILNTEAKGPTYARYLCSTLWDGQEYYLQIDSHTKFVKGWDTKCIDMIKKIKELGLSKKPVISHYPKEYFDAEKNNDKNKHTVPRICKSFFNTRDMLSFMGAEILDTNNKFYNTPYIAAGMVFSESYFLNELPYDPNLPYLFVGEEILHSIRFYTWGWDVFTPTENIIFHEYTRKDKPKIWTDNPTYSDKDAFEKVKVLIGFIKDDSTLPPNMKKDLTKYGLGNIRTLQDYYTFAGIDLKERVVKKNFCRKDNIADEKDIRLSNENKNNEDKKKNKKKDKDNYNSDAKYNNYTFYYLLFLSILLIITVLFTIYIK